MALQKNPWVISGTGRLPSKSMRQHIREFGSICHGGLRLSQRGNPRQNDRDIFGAGVYFGNKARSKLDRCANYSHYSDWSGNRQPQFLPGIVGIESESVKSAFLGKPYQPRTSDMGIWYNSNYFLPFSQRRQLYQIPMLLYQCYIIGWRRIFASRSVK